MVEAILALLIFGPALLVWTLRASGAMAFLSLCTGYAIFNFSSNDINRLFGQLHTSVNSSLISIAIVLLPPVLTLVLTHHGVQKSKRPLQVLPALACGGLLALTIVPLLTDSVSGDFYSSQFWTYIVQYQSGIVGIGALISLLLIWVDSFSKSKDKKKSKS